MKKTSFKLFAFFLFAGALFTILQSLPSEGGRSGKQRQAQAQERGQAQPPPLSAGDESHGAAAASSEGGDDDNGDEGDTKKGATAADEPAQPKKQEAKKDIKIVRCSLKKVTDPAEARACAQEFLGKGGAVYRYIKAQNEQRFGTEKDCVAPSADRDRTKTFFYEKSAKSPGLREGLAQSQIESCVQQDKDSFACSLTKAPLGCVLGKSGNVTTARMIVNKRGILISCFPVYKAARGGQPLAAKAPAKEDDDDDDDVGDESHGAAAESSEGDDDDNDDEGDTKKGATAADEPAQPKKQEAEKDIKIVRCSLKKITDPDEARACAQEFLRKGRLVYTYVKAHNWEHFGTEYDCKNPSKKRNLRNTFFYEKSPQSPGFRASLAQSQIESCVQQDKSSFTCLLTNAPRGCELGKSDNITTARMVMSVRGVLVTLYPVYKAAKASAEH